MSEHTPTPWKWRDDFKHLQGSPRDGEQWGEPVTNHGGLSKPRTTGLANAAFIIKAVNAWYDADALRQRISELESK